MDVYNNNTAAIHQYYPFVTDDTNNIYFSHRYLSLIEDWLDDINVTAEFCENPPIKLPEYADQDVYRIDTSKTDFVINHKILYKHLCASYNANYWYQSVKNITFESVLIDLSDSDVEYILSNYTHVQTTELYNKIQRAITKLGGRVFVRLYSLSSKPGEPATNSKQVIQQLRCSRTLHSLRRGVNHGIMLRKWIDDFPYKQEYRLFVYGFKLRCISQNIGAEILFDDDIVDKSLTYNVICEWWDNNKHFIIYDDVVIDVVIINKIVTLIEINSWGPGLLAGSALFEWISDYDIMHYSTKPVIRFASDL